MRFLIVVPTVRQERAGFSEAMERIRASFTQPTEFHTLDGFEGKAQTLNAAYDSLLVPSDADIYVTLDDDLIPPIGWQDAMVREFDADPTLGALGLWLGEPHREYMGLSADVQPEKSSGGALVSVTSHLVGCLIAFRREVAQGVGKIPASDEKYQYWEDGWRGGRVRALGFEQAYVVCPDGLPELVEYVDPFEYTKSKADDIESARKRVGRYVGGSFWQRALRRIRRGL